MPVENVAYSVFEQLAQQLPEQFVVGVNSRQIQEQILESVALPDTKPSFFGANYLKKDNQRSFASYRYYNATPNQLIRAAL